MLSLYMLNGGESDVKGCAILHDNAKGGKSYLPHLPFNRRVWYNTCVLQIVIIIC